VGFEFLKIVEPLLASKLGPLSYDNYFWKLFFLPQHLSLYPNIISNIPILPFITFSNLIIFYFAVLSFFLGTNTNRNILKVLWYQFWA
jgi:hypothetical protein